MSLVEAAVFRRHRDCYQVPSQAATAFCDSRASHTWHWHRLASDHSFIISSSMCLPLGSGIYSPNQLPVCFGMSLSEVCCMLQPSSPNRRRPHLTAEHYTDVDSAPPLDEEEIQEAVYSLLVNKAPPVLVRLLGRDCYKQ